MKIFISYNSRVKEVVQFAKKLKSKLDELEEVSETFIFQNPKKNPAGATWDDKLAKKIRDCDAFIAIITQGYLDSDICHDEFHAAHVTHKKLIIPIIFEDKNLRPDYKKGKHGAAIEMGIKPKNWVIFKTTDVEESASEGEMSPYEQVLTGLGFEFVPDETEVSSIQDTQDLVVKEDIEDFPKLYERPRKIDVLEQLVCIDTEWRQIGNGLGLSSNFLNGLAQSHEPNQIRLDKVLQKWMDMNGHPPCSPVTWKAILDVLKGKLLQKHELVKEIYQYLKPQESLKRQTVTTPPIASRPPRNLQYKFKPKNIADSQSNETKAAEYTKGGEDTESTVVGDVEMTTPPTARSCKRFKQEEVIDDNVDEVTTPPITLLHKRYEQEKVIGINDINRILNKRPDEDHIIDLLSEYADKYMEFSTALKVGSRYAMGLNGDNKVKLIQVISEWMSRQCSPITWRTIIDVVESKTLGKKIALANEIRRWLGKDENFTYYMNKDY